MPISKDAESILNLLPTEGNSSRNRAYLVKQLGLDRSAVDVACDELISADLAVRDGKRIARASASAVVAGLSKTAVRIFTSIPTDGSSIGGAKLRSAVNVQNDAYKRALDELEQAGAITVGPGRGGSIRSAFRVEDTPAPPTGRQEKDLYKPFVDWLKSSWPAPAQSTLFQEALVTATPRGWKRKSGTWTRPDVTELRVDRYDLLPEGQRVQLELSSYEIKPAGAPQVEWVFEAAAQARWAHRSTLVLETPDTSWSADDRIIGEVRRFNLGLYYMTCRDPSANYEARVVLEPGLQTPDPAYLHDAVRRFIEHPDNPDLMQRYRGAIGF